MSIQVWEFPLACVFMAVMDLSDFELLPNNLLEEELDREHLYQLCVLNAS